MNSEELEQSLRTEFETYLNNVLAEVRQEVSEFQKQFEAEFEKHKSQIDDVFKNFSSRIAADKNLEASFTETVVEHLRLSRDEGARITATAFAEAEELEKQNAVESAAFVEAPGAVANYGGMRDAINDISTKTTQSAILKALVHHATEFTPRGAFFIIKNEHLVGWRVFGQDGDHADEHAVREIFFPVASSTVLGDAVRSLTSVQAAHGTYSDDALYLNKLEFSNPTSMFAIPLVVRGRGVAALYADNGSGTDEVNVEALETLVRVASLTVEVLASSRGAHGHSDADDHTASYGHVEEAPKAAAFMSPAAETAAVEHMPVVADEQVVEKVEASVSTEPSYSYDSPVEDSYSYQPIQPPVETLENKEFDSVEGDSFSFRSKTDRRAEVPGAVAESNDFSSESAWNAPAETESYYQPDIAVVEAPEPVEYAETPAVETPESQFDSAPVAETVAETFEAPSYEMPSYDAASFEPAAYEAPAYEAPAYEAPAYETPAFEAPSYQPEVFEPAAPSSFDAVPVVETAVDEAPVVEAAMVETPVAEAAMVETPVAEVASKARGRFNDRNVDLPIEVSEDERRLHNDARRFARLLVSEIKLYNEQRVKEGRENSDLYDRLREAIDRSREMYDKRVQPPVAAKFDYFNYELVSNLAEGDENKLGASYPGATV